MYRTFFILITFVVITTLSITIAQEQVREVATPQSVAQEGTVPSCVALLHTWEDATEQAQTYSSIVDVVRSNGSEIMYQEAEHYRSAEDGSWIRDVSLERSFLPFPVPNSFDLLTLKIVL